MADIKERLDKIKGRISDPNFLANKGLSNEVGIHIFAYSPTGELIVRDYIGRLKASPSHHYRIVERNIYSIFLEILEEKRVLSRVPLLEEARGAPSLQKELQKAVTPADFLQKIDYQPHLAGDVLFLTGVGEAHPFVRVHTMLDHAQKLFTDMPIVVFYPGEFNGRDLILFKKFHDQHYYRAFNLI